MKLYSIKNDKGQECEDAGVKWTFPSFAPLWLCLHLQKKTLNQTLSSRWPRGKHWVFSQLEILIFTNSKTGIQKYAVLLNSWCKVASLKWRWVTVMLGMTSHWKGFNIIMCHLRQRCKPSRTIFFKVQALKLQFYEHLKSDVWPGWSEQSWLHDVFASGLNISFSASLLKQMLITKALNTCVQIDDMGTGVYSDKSNRDCSAVPLVPISISTLHLNHRADRGGKSAAVKTFGAQLTQEIKARGFVRCELRLEKWDWGPGRLSSFPQRPG